jgi:hypothetical protein
LGVGTVERDVLRTLTLARRGSYSEYHQGQTPAVAWASSWT